MTLVARIVLRLYPQGWRERYCDEYEALLDDHGVDVRTLADMARGVVDARIRDLAGASPERRQRAALAACLWAVTAAAVAVAGFVKMVEYDDFRAAAARHAPVAAGRDLILAGAGIVALAVCAGGLVVSVALWRGLRQDGPRDLARPLAAAVIATAVVALGPPVLAMFAHAAPSGSPHDPRTIALVGAWLAVSAIAVAVALAATGRILAGVSLGAGELRMAMRAAWVAAAGLCMIAGGLLLWGIALGTESARVFGLPEGGLMATPTRATWMAEMALGAGAAFFAVLTLMRAGGASPRPRSAPSSPPSPPPAGRSSSSG